MIECHHRPRSPTIRASTGNLTESIALLNEISKPSTRIGPTRLPYRNADRAFAPSSVWLPRILPVLVVAPWAVGLPGLWQFSVIARPWPRDRSAPQTHRRP